MSIKSVGLATQRKSTSDTAVTGARSEMLSTGEVCETDTEGSQLCFHCPTTLQAQYTIREHTSITQRNQTGDIQPV